VSLKHKLEAAFYKNIGFGSYGVFYSRHTRRHNIIPKETNKKLKLFDKEHIRFSMWK
jgi:hypothetical protein